MKTQNILSTIICFFSLLVFISCESREPKSDDAFERFKEEKLMSQDSTDLSHAIIPVSKTAVQNDNMDEWARFKTEMEIKIHANENRIKLIKAGPDAHTKLFSKLTRLEKENTDLRKQLNDYEKERNANLENFKLNMNQDVKDIGTELKEIPVTAKK